MSVATIDRITEKLHTLSASDIIELEGLLDGYAADSLLPPDTIQALEDVRLGNVTKCESVEELFRELEIEV